MVSRVIRDETPADADGVRRVLERAFDTSAEADLVAQIRADQAATVACVALDRDENTETETIVGQILFSPITLQQAPTTLVAAGTDGTLVRHAGCAYCRNGILPGQN